METNLESHYRGFRTPIARWARFGPYYAMFPIDFTFEIVNKYSKQGDYVLDPFAGRCSSIYASAALDRHGIGIEINPIGWLYGSVKLHPAQKDVVIKRLGQIYIDRYKYHEEVNELPEFFFYCFCKDVLLFLVSARQSLNWKINHTDATLMSILLVYLHGKLGEGLSNQMRQTKAMGDTYSIKWWKSKNMEKPPNINPYEFILKKINWRYLKGTPDLLTHSKVYLADSEIEFSKVENYLNKKQTKCSLLFTSPPYCGITDYHVDQWLRLWLLGGNDKPKSSPEKNKGRFNSKTDYIELLDRVFNNCSKVMAQDSVIYVRTDARNFTYNATISALEKNFPSYNMEIKAKPFKNRTQTQLFGDFTPKKGEIDIILSR